MTKRNKCWRRWGLIFSLLGSTWVARAVDLRACNPYYSAVVMEAGSGQVLWEDHAGAEIYPASIVKLMTLFVVLDDVKSGRMQRNELVAISRAAEQIGGRQVWLRKGEVFSLEELICATIVHSANDAAMALAIHTSGSKAVHIKRMNAKAKEIGLHSTFFHNVHGLPPGPGQLPDVSSALDIARLADALLQQHPEILKYTSISFREFREVNPVKLTSSNKLLQNVAGCDGLKTGYFRAGGFSIVATAKRNDVRIIAVVMGCTHSKTRNRWAERLLERGFVERKY
jgi:serine-type D-Ala-D-Ala carboxypeptidase (penicillin-binding protein 5/6)